MEQPLTETEDHEHGLSMFKDAIPSFHVFTIPFTFFISITSIFSGIAMLVIVHFMLQKYVPQLRPGSLHLLRALTVADIFRALLTFLGVLRFAWYLPYFKEANLSKEACNSTGYCYALAVLNQWSNLAAYFWTLSIGIYFWFKAFRRHRRLKRKSMDGIFTTFHCICWFVPILPPVFAFTFGRLGDNFSPLTWTGLCGVSSCGSNCTVNSTCESKTIVDVSVAATSKFWEVCITLVIFGIYVHSKMDLWRMTRRARIQMKQIDYLSRPRRKLRPFNNYRSGQPSTSRRTPIEDSRILSISADLQSIDLTTPSSTDIESDSRGPLSPPLNRAGADRRRLTDSTEKALAKKTQLSELKEEHLFYLLIILLYLGRVWGTIRYFISLGENYWPYDNTAILISNILLVIQSLGDCSQASMNLIVFLVHSSQAREICLQMYNGIRDKFRRADAEDAQLIDDDN